MAIHSNGQTDFSFPHIEGIRLGTGEEVDEVCVFILGFWL